jgi:hypothetical protein
MISAARPNKRLKLPARVITRPNFLLSSAVAFLASSCEVSTPDHSVNAVLMGAVTRSGTAHLTGASILVEVTDTTGAPWSISEHLGVTDSAGKLVRVIGVFLAPEFVGRVRVTIQPPEEASLPDSTLDVGHVRFRIGTPDTLSFALVYP